MVERGLVAVNILERAEKEAQLEVTSFKVTELEVKNNTLQEKIHHPEARDESNRGQH